MLAKQQLLKELDELVELAEEQTRLHVSSRQCLYKGLAGVYLWWRQATQIDGFLNEQYELHNITAREKDGEEKFTRVLRLVWRMDWAAPSAAQLQQWSMALRKLHNEYETNADAYRNNAREKLALLIENANGIRVFIGMADKAQPETPDIERKPTGKDGGAKKQKEQQQDDELIFTRHVELAELYFAKTAKPITKLAVKTPVAVSRKGYALALVRQNMGGTYDVLSTLNNDALLEQAIVGSYKRDKTAAPLVLRQLAEAIATQSLPVALERHRYALTEVSKHKDAQGRRVRQNKRLLFRHASKDILLSENRTGCSVVTVATPKVFPIAAAENVYLSVNDRRYIEQAIIQKHDLSIYAANASDEIPTLKSQLVASYRLMIENKVTGKVHSLYFYNQSVSSPVSKPQACIDTEKFPQAVWCASANEQWAAELNAKFVSSWLREYGGQITRPKHKAVLLSFDKTSFSIKHYGERGNFTHESGKFHLPKVHAKSSKLSAMFLAKDLLPALAALADMDITGNIELAASDGYLAIGYNTALCRYVVWVPTCTKDGKRIETAFTRYEG
jgi:hypothetical protein